MRGVFVTGTDTEVGKTVLAGAICAAAAAKGMHVAAFKPVVTGINEPEGPSWPRDHDLLATVANAGQRPDEIAPYTYEPAVSPHLAQELADDHLDPDDL